MMVTNLKCTLITQADSTSISDNFISALFEDDENYIWVGTTNGYLNKFNRKTETFTRYNINDYFDLVDEPETEYYEYPLAFSRNQVNTITSIKQDAEWLSVDRHLGKWFDKI